MINVSIFNDQISAELEEALTLLSSWGYTHVDLREQIFGETVIDGISSRQREILVGILGRYPLKVGCLGTRRLIVRPTALSDQTDLLSQLIRTAIAVKTSYIRICSDDRLPDGAARHEQAMAAVPNFRMLCDQAREHGITLLLENKPTSLTNRGSELRDMVMAVDRPNLKVVWDAVNSWQGGFADVAKDYAAVRELIGIVHLRGAVGTSDDPSVFDSSEILGDDTFPNSTILSWLVQDQYDGQITLDLSLGQIRRYQSKQLTGAAISRISLDRMTHMIQEATKSQ